MNEKKMTVNPMWVLFLGACPALGATGTLKGAVAMGVTVLAVMLLTALVTALLRRILPERALIAATVLTAALFTSAAQLVLHAVLPSVYKMLGVYLAVAAVNLLVFSRSAGSELAAAWVEAITGSAGALARISRSRPRSCTITALTPAAHSRSTWARKRKRRSHACERPPGCCAATGRCYGG